MELRDFIKQFGGHWISYAALILFTGALAMVFSLTRPVTYDASVSFAVNRANKILTTDYEYDGYYAIQAADLISQTVVSWFSTPSVVVEIYNKAGLDPQLNSLDSAGSKFKTRKYSSQNIVVKFSMSTRAEAEKLSSAVTAVTEARASQLNQTADAKALFTVLASTPVIVKHKINTVLNTVVGLALGVILAVFISSIKNYWNYLPAVEHENRN